MLAYARRDNRADRIFVRVARNDVDPGSGSGGNNGGGGGGGGCTGTPGMMCSAARPSEGWPIALAMIALFLRGRRSRSRG